MTRGGPRAVAALTALAGLLACLRLYSWSEPLERDITHYALVARELLAGRPLFSDLVVNRPPLVFWIYAGAQILTGAGPGSLYLLWLAFSTATLLAVHACGAAAGGGRATGLWAAAFWVALACDARLQANQPNTEIFMNASLIGALALLLGDRGRGSGVPRALGFGALVAAACHLKPYAALAGVALALAHVARPPAFGARGRALRQMAVAGAVVGASWAALFAWQYRRGSWSDFWTLMVDYNRYYSGDAASNLLQGLEPGRLLPSVLLPALPLIAAALAGGGALLGRRARLPRAEWLLAAYAGAIWLLVAMPGRFFAHYYQLWLPWLAVVGARALAGLGRNPPAAWMRRRTLAAAVLALLALGQLPYYRLSAEGWSRLKYGEMFIDVERLGRSLGSLLAPGESFFLYGADNGLYYYSGARFVPGVIWMDFLRRESPVEAVVTRRLLAELSAERPELVVVASHAPRSGLLVDWIRARYRRLPDDSAWAPFALHARVGGPLEARLLAGESGGR